MLSHIYTLDNAGEWWTVVETGLPAHLVSALRMSYVCQLCGSVMFPSMEGWMEKDVELAWMPSGMVIANKPQIGG